jgi:hypothetical protein
MPYRESLKIYRKIHTNQYTEGSEKMKKEELLKECTKVLERPNVSAWYRENFEGKPQSETIKTLNSAILSCKLSVYEGLCICLIVGVQWNDKFEGVP